MTMRVVCSECTIIYDTKPGPDGEVSHGLCLVCGPRAIRAALADEPYAEWMPDIYQAMNY